MKRKTLARALAGGLITLLGTTACDRSKEDVSVAYIKNIVGYKEIGILTNPIVKRSEYSNGHVAYYMISPTEDAKLSYFIKPENMHFEPASENNQRDSVWICNAEGKYHATRFY